jgi:hypothetical protein
MRVELDEQTLWEIEGLVMGHHPCQGIEQIVADKGIRGRRVRFADDPPELGGIKSRLLLRLQAGELKAVSLAKGSLQTQLPAAPLPEKLLTPWQQSEGRRRAPH